MTNRISKTARATGDQPAATPDPAGFLPSSDSAAKPQAAAASACAKSECAPIWPSWPERCERALIRYLTGQLGRNPLRNLARAEVDQMLKPATSRLRSQRGPSQAA
jgi:hypothetical protein